MVLSSLINYIFTHEDEDTTGNKALKIVSFFIILIFGLAFGLMPYFM